MDSGLIGKIEKAKWYAQDPSRVTPSSSRPYSTVTTPTTHSPLTIAVGIVNVRSTKATRRAVISWLWIRSLVKCSLKACLLRPSYSSNRRITKQAFCPPNPKLLDNTVLTSFLRASFGT